MGAEYAGARSRSAVGEEVDSVAMNYYACKIWLPLPLKQPGGRDSPSEGVDSSGGGGP